MGESMLYDAHNHLQDEWLAPHLEMLDRQLRELDLAAAVVNGTEEHDWPQVSDLSRRFDWVRPSYGLHPWYVGNRSAQWLDSLRARLAAEPAAAVGEIGLDRWMLDRARPDDPRLAGLRRAPIEEQTEIFTAQLALAAAENRAVTIHCLQAWGALDAVLRGRPTPARGFLLHAYNGPKEMIARFAEQGAYFSFNAYFLDPRKTLQQEVFKRIPADRLLVETDAPAMLPPLPWRTHKLPRAPGGETVNSPANIESAYLGLAALRQTGLAELATQVAENFARLFG